MSELKMPRKGQSAVMMAELQAEHASKAEPAEPQETNVTTLQEPAPSTPEPVPPESRTKTKQSEPLRTPRAEPSGSREERLTLALERAETDQIGVVTVRVSESLNRYMDDYVARINRIDPKRKYRKQDAVGEAFAAFYADHPMPAPPPDEDL